MISIGDPKVKAARKQARQEKKSERQAVRADKKEARQQGREDEREARADGRADRKEAREEARETKRDARNEARDLRRDARRDPDASRKEARQEAREVKQAGRAEAKETKADARAEARSDRKDARDGARDSKREVRAEGRARMQEVRDAGREQVRAVRSEPDVFGLQVDFALAIGERERASATFKADAEATVLEWIRVAEDLYDREPRLEIDPAFTWNVPFEGKLRSNDLVFEDARDRRKWLDDNFDNVVGESRTEGCLRVLVVESLADDDGAFGGAAWQPHSVRPFGRKTGIVLSFSAKAGSFAHELGHIFSLVHTFESYPGLRKDCNKDYEKGEEGKGSTLRDDGLINVMDYGKSQSGVKGYFLNECQEKRAAKQRRLYLTARGEVNYKRLKGNR